MSFGFTPFPWLALIVLLVLFFGSLKSRGRLRRLPVLSVSAAPADGDSSEFRAVTAVGVRLEAELVGAAAAYARREGLLVLDLVPGDMPVEPLMDLLHDVDPVAFRTDPVAAGRGAGHALLVHESVLARAEVDRLEGLSTVELIAMTAKLKRYAARGTGHAVAPGLAAIAPDPRMVKARMRALGAPPAAVLAGYVGEAGAFAGATYTTPFWGLLALATWWLQPYAVLTGQTAVRPRGAHFSTLLRPFLAVWRWVRAVSGPAAPPAMDKAELAVKRAGYAEAVAGGIEHFFEERRDDCPWCGSGDLRVRVRLRDRLQAKPGRFSLEQCRTCGHIFQNPRLSLAGLDYYYRDFYDGYGARGAEAMFATMRRQYNGRTTLVKRHASPGRWLDVGTGHAHMCLIGKSALPDTVFDGLDLGAGVEEAARRGWVDHAYVGQFPDHADTLAGAYDVVSMNHYLEHARDPFAELDAAAKVVQPGGHLLVEIPDPECWYARLLGRHWHPWFQPQHQHFIPVGNLSDALAARGFTVVEVERGPSHQGGLLTAALTHVATGLAPDPQAPWRPRPAGVLGRTRRVGVIVLLIPAYIAAAVLDAVGGKVAGRFGRAGGSDAYRLLARKDPG
ncbi:class I SAM-dependent methyltransferase [Yinghuangia soli]|uniref:Class I SAM-dependent methyltransferase n=1 Tax=Yinghuangia soli TaxID=2908204 RepID=A0AA41Q3N8_9ACTN|nr:class I SAM-dependent methyltransferase [Yinghuangia soli]MCF2530958.1 class I SAM-dependent methyltransferase [Yinghuangia soli]